MAKDRILSPMGLLFYSDIKMSHTLILDEEIAFGNIILRNGIQVKVNISQ